MDTRQDRGWHGYSEQPVEFTRGVPVLKWASSMIREDKALVQFLVWSNPSNLCFASPALQADKEVLVGLQRSSSATKRTNTTSCPLPRPRPSTTRSTRACP